MPPPWSNLDVLDADDLNKLVPVVAKLQRNTTQSIANNTNDQIDWSTALIDSHGGWSAGTPSRWTCPSAAAAGLYAYNGIASFAVNATSTRAVHLLKNGSNVDGSQVILNGNASASTLSMFHAGLIELAEGDYIEVNVFQLSGGALNISPSTLTYCTLNLHRILAA